MTLREQLADVLREHGDLCTRANADHLADALLAQDGIAIVRLPKGSRYTSTSPIVVFPQGVRGDERGRVLIDTTPIELDKARELAAALLAAAAAAQQLNQQEAKGD